MIGRHGVGNVNDNGILLLSKYAEHRLLMTNTTFRMKDKHKTSWMHPRSKHWHLIDYVITRQRDRADVLSTRAMAGSTACSTDHRLIRAKVAIRIAPKHRKQQTSRRRFDVGKLKDLDTSNQFKPGDLQERLLSKPDDNLSVEEHWTHVKTALTDACKEAFGFKTKRHQDWFNENDKEIKRLIEKANVKLSQTGKTIVIVKSGKLNYHILAGLDIGYVPAVPHAFLRLPGQFGPPQFIFHWPLLVFLFFIFLVLCMPPLFVLGIGKTRKATLIRTYFSLYIYI